MTTKTKDRDVLIMAHLPMVRRVAKRMSARYPSSVELDDLLSIGTMGLIDASNRYDSSRDTTFSAYAQIRVKGAIVDELRKQDWVPRTVRSRNREIETAKSTLAQRGANTDATNVAKQLGVKVQDLANMERNSQVYTQVSMWERRSDSDQRVADTLACSDPNPAQTMDQTDLRSVLLQAVRTLPKRDQTIVQLYYFEERSFREIGEMLGVTESRISQIHSRIKRRLRDNLQTNPTSE